MMTRFLVEKTEPFQFDEREMLLEIRDVLNIPGITRVRLFNGYDFDGFPDVEKAKHMVFSETGQDIVYEDEPDTGGAACVFVTAAAAGQFDQREDSAVTLLRLMEPHSEPVVGVFKIVALYGEISEPDIDKIKAYYINPLETREVLLTGVKTGVETEVETKSQQEPENVETIKGFIDADDNKLTTLAAKYEIAMALDNLKLCRDYFSKEERDPTVTEMKVLDTYWSDHCRHSTFMTVIEDVSIDENRFTEGLKRAQTLYKHAKSYVYGDDPRPLCLMDIATMEMKKLKKSGDLDDMEKSDEVNACSIEVTVPVDGEPTDMIVMFKNETHNHPTEMEPFGGASTCLGGAIRDPLSGRAYVYGAIRVTGSGDPREQIEDTLPGKLPQRKITQTAAKGYSSYGNGIGLPLGHLMEFYDPGFKAKRMECGAVVAAARKADIFRGKPQPGDVVVLVGGRTGRDGCGGATGSSKEHDDESLEKGGAEVQKGNPVIERNIVRLFRKPHVSKTIKLCNDFGAGGVCVAVGELADGLDIDLDKVPVKYPGLNGTELAISESQERMAVVLAESDLQNFLTEAAAENLEAVKIADITDTGHVVMTWRDNEILDISSEFLNSGGVRQSTKVVVAHKGTVLLCDSHSSANNHTAEPSPCAKQAWLDNLADLNVCSKKGIAGTFDSTAGGGTVFIPYGGVCQKTPEQGLAMRLPLLEGETDFGTLMTVGYDPALCEKSPFHAAVYAVIESVMKIVAMGGDYRKVRLSFQEYFEKLTSEERWGKPYAALMGAFLAQDELGIPAIGGKDSMSGTFNDINVPPSLISFAVAVADTTKLVSRAFKNAGSSVYLLKTPVDDGGVPNFGILKDNMGSVQNLMKYGCVKSASNVGKGGIAAAISEMAFGNEIGFTFDPGFKDDLFSPQYTSMILELGVVPKDTKQLRGEFILLGTTSKKKSIEINGVSIPLDEALDSWESVLNSVFPIPPSSPVVEQNHHNQPTITILNPAKKPKVLIPIFPGTTGEYMLEKQFKKAGADVKTSLFRTLTAKDIQESYKELTDAINNADILALPSGMSAGAEPDGSGKLITIILKHPDIKDAINRLITERKGLVFGTGEGFKALLKTGLIQAGQVQEEESGDIVLVKNLSNKYNCTLKTVKIEQSDSPWLTGMKDETETVPVSGLEDTVCMSPELHKKYFNNGQIVSSYIEYSNGKPHCSIEALVSKNGQVLGRTSLVENLSKGLYSNVFEANESRIFTNAIQYINNRGSV